MQQRVALEIKELRQVGTDLRLTLKTQPDKTCLQEL